MQVRVLGSAAGGGLPQWNCSCRNCSRARKGDSSVKRRTQAQVAWTAISGQWTLLNASPDLRAQIEEAPELWPRGEGRHSPITDIILTGAEVDQILGLLLLREFHSYRVHATAAVHRILMEDNSVFGVLARITEQVRWHDIPVDDAFTAGGARVEALPLAGRFPRFVSASRVSELNPAEAALGFLVSTESGGGALAFLLNSGPVSDALLERLQDYDVVFFDGTFWTDEEPLRIPGVNRSARQMGHLPISGAGGSLERFNRLGRQRKIYIHINNTNPILDEESPENRIVRESGWEVAWDGMEIAL